MKPETILAIDPGSSESGIVIVCGRTLLDAGVAANERVLRWLRTCPSGDPDPKRGPGFRVPRTLAIERPGGYAVGTHAARHLFETIEWSGRFIETWNLRGERWVHVGRAYVKSHLLGNPKGDDRDVRRAIIGRWGGRACPACVDGRAFGPAVATSSRTGRRRGPRCSVCRGSGWRTIPKCLRALRADSDAWAALGVAMTYRDEADLGRRP